MFSIFKINDYLSNWLTFGIKSGGGGSSQPATTTQTQKTEPWSGVQPYMKDVFRQAQSQYNSDLPSYYPDDTYLPYSQDTMQGIDMMRDISTNNPLPQAAGYDAFTTMTGGYLNENPYLDDAVSSVASDVQNSVNSSFAGAGRYGSNAHADTLADSVGDISAKMRYQNYGDERENMARYQAPPNAPCILDPP